VEQSLGEAGALPAFHRVLCQPWVKSYFDIGNHVKYAPPQDWIQALGPLIAKVHIKDFKLNPDGHGGKFVHPRDGSVDWPVVRRALSERLRRLGDHRRRWPGTRGVQSAARLDRGWRVAPARRPCSTQNLTP